ncbi:hypothetical protein D3C71_1541370 [compost metagenome]
MDALLFAASLEAHVGVDIHIPDGHVQQPVAVDQIIQPDLPRSTPGIFQTQIGKTGLFTRIVKLLVEEGGVVHTCTDIRTHFAAGITKVPLRHQGWRELMNRCNISRRTGADFVAEWRCRQKFNTDIFRCHIGERQAQLGIVADVEAAQTPQHIVRSLCRANRCRTRTNKELARFMCVRTARNTA